MLKRILRKLIPQFLIGWYHFLLAFLGALFYGFPSGKIKIIGITGTNGKTTTANLICAILEEAGYKVAVASSIKFKIGQKQQENKFKMTMPGRAYLQKFLREAVRANCQYAIIEATSEGVLQHRHRFINFQAMVFTNLSAEHIERHKGFENYRAAKGEYFKRCKGTHILNLDDENIEYFMKYLATQKIGYGLGIFNFQFSIFKQFSSSNFQTIKAENIREESNGQYFSIQGEIFYLPLMGKFNIYNALAAICAGLSQGVSLEVCQKALAKVSGVPGRMEEVISIPFRVIVDYAFTPNALEQVYITLRQGAKLPAGVQQPTKLICVLGACGGGRDKWKRPILGELAAKYCDEIILTNEDPYDEPPMDIIDQITGGVQGAKLLAEKELSSLQVSKILDRREAIRKALTLARPGDTVVITGKGSEPWLCVKDGKKLAWDDRKIAREEFDNLKNDKQKRFYQD